MPNYEAKKVNQQEHTKTKKREVSTEDTVKPAAARVVRPKVEEGSPEVKLTPSLLFRVTKSVQKTEEVLLALTAVSVAASGEGLADFVPKNKLKVASALETTLKTLVDDGKSLLSSGTGAKATRDPLYWFWVETQINFLDGSPRGDVPILFTHEGG